MCTGHCLSQRLKQQRRCFSAVPLLQGQPVSVLPDYGWKPPQTARGHQGDVHVGPEGLPWEHQKALGQGRRDGHETGRRVAARGRNLQDCASAQRLFHIPFHVHVFRHSSTEPSTVQWPSRPTWATTPSLCTPWTDGRLPITAWW